ncbi:putative fatty acyl-CoA reductase CG8306, partial [Pseudomyrmex gracilis]|uniref:putative fatty acyl-CoA reductase CG8306 n=1 Tax=Pseudomyrmex gracilis TaxID=219809 RepID=UPI0009950976
SNLDKLIPISGDVTAKDLGLLPNDRQLLIERVSIIFHIAAIVRFDESLKNIIFSNLRATRDVCILAQSMKNIVALHHMSSAYTQSDKPVVDEILYPLKVDWRQTIKIAESVDEEILKIFTTKYIGTFVNTYVFTKRLAEQIISDFSESLPCIIFRPSIVLSTIKDPIPGWSDNFNGPIGLNIGGGIGILRVAYADSSLNCDFIPIDLVIRAMLIVSWKRGIQSISEDNTVHIYNSSLCNIKSISLSEMLSTGLRNFSDIPFERIIWKPNVIMTKSRLLYYILMIILHIVPALFIDRILKLFGANPMLIRLQRKVYVANHALSFFLIKFFQFNNINFISVFENLSADNEKEFGYKELINFDVEEYCKNSLIGYKLYLLNEDMNRLEQARRNFKR